jgi:chitinase/chitodextrinase
MPLLTRPAARQREFVKLFAALLAAALAVLGLVAVSSGSASAAASLPTHLLTGYWQNFDNGATDLKLSQVPTSYSIVAVAFADADPAKPGGVTFTLDPTLSSKLGGYTTAAFKADIATLHAQGRKVIISVGGQNGAISLPDATAAGNFATSVYGLMQTYGFDGVDIDLENAPNLTNMTSALNQLSAKAGSSLVLTMAPETLYVQPGGTYLALIDAVKSLITVVNTQYYNSGAMIGQDGKVYSAGTVDFETALADILLNGHLRADQVGLGLPASPSGAGSGYVAPSVVNNALDCLATGTNCGSYKPTAKYPTIRGAMDWSINWDASNGYNFANTVGGHLGSLPGGTPVTTPPTTGTTTSPTAPPTTNPPPTTTPPVTTCAGASAWVAATPYSGGAVVSYNGHLWTAKWWTQGDTPGSNAQGVWTDGGACTGSTTTAPPGSCTVAAWVAATAYNGGAVVSYGGHKWTAKWWTQGDTPGSNSQGVWTDNGAC